MNKIIFAPAGGRKTQSLIDICCSGDVLKKRLILTYTSTGQNILNNRLWRNNGSQSEFQVMGWFSFLLKHIIKPYIYDLFPNQEVCGLHFVEGACPSKWKSGAARFFDSSNRVYSSNIGKLAFDIIVKSNGSCINRLENIYDEILIDEVQDLCANDLEIIKILLHSKINIIAVGDVRQSILRTTMSDQKNKKYNGLQKITWFREMSALGLCEIEEIKTTWRCNQEIINFADSVLPSDLEFPSTYSEQKEKTSHDGIYVVSWKNLRQYLQTYSPECYRDKVTSKILEGTTAINYRMSKGKTVDRALIYPTEPIRKFLKNGTALADNSASTLYVIISRAIYSVAFVIENPQDYLIQEWTPNN